MGYLPYQLLDLDFVHRSRMGCLDYYRDGVANISFPVLVSLPGRLGGWWLWSGTQSPSWNRCCLKTFLEVALAKSQNKVLNKELFLVIEFSDWENGDKVAIPSKAPMRPWPTRWSPGTGMGQKLYPWKLSFFFFLGVFPTFEVLR